MCTCAPALVQLRRQVDDAWPGRDRKSDGCCGDDDHRNRKSDHNPAANGYAHALDIDEDIVAGMGDRPLWDFAVHLLADVRVRYLIYEAQLLYPDGRIKPYSGVNAHRHHLHISIHTRSTHDNRPWGTVPGPHQEDDMPKPTDVVDVLDAPEGGTWVLTADGGVVTEGAAPFHGSYPALRPQQRRGQRYFVAITRRRDLVPGYVLWANDGNKYTFGPGDEAET